MPSPFPGMDPYLETPDLWPDVHNNLIIGIQDALNHELRRDYVARVELRVYIANEEDERAMIPDVRIEKVNGGHKSRNGGSALVIAEPIIVPLMLDEEIQESRVEIKHAKSGSFVAVIEVLSPTNKIRGSDGRASFMKKRHEVMHSNSHWVEIDLLRQGQPSFPIHKTDCDYQAHASRVEMRPRGHVWPIHLRDRLPVIQIPLRSPDGDLSLDLQQVCDLSYDRAAYDRTLDYQRDPNAPLSPTDAAWADALLREKGVRK